jgi:predicted RNA-binding protein associated with RNAse of E/G family
LSLDTVDIHYRRLPDRISVFHQLVLERTPDRVVTFLPAAELREPLRVYGRVILEPGSPVIWFTYPGRWHDIGRFHLADGQHTGSYANILTPVRVDGRRWETTDLCLDVWRDADGSVRLLDEVELEEALAAGWIEPETATQARIEAEALMESAREDRWPPPEVREWTLERAKTACRPSPDEKETAPR